MTESSLHYHLVSGQILYQVDGENGPGIITLNSLVKTEDGKLNLQMIGRAQQVLQANFLKKVGEVKVQIVDVIILAITNLGVFTEDEFTRSSEVVVPKGLADA